MLDFRKQRAWPFWFAGYDGIVKLSMGFLCLLLCHTVWASPAQELFDEVVYWLDYYYEGSSSYSPREFEAEFRSALLHACKPTPDQCSEAVAEPIIRDYLLALGDTHTHYYDAPTYRAYQTKVLSDSVKGFGLTVKAQDGLAGLVILDVLLNGPAYQAGLKRGDVILTIDNVQLPLPLEERYGYFKQVEATEGYVFLQVQRRGQETFAVDLRAMELSVDRLPSLVWLQPGLAYLKIPSFLPQGKVSETIHNLIAYINSQADLGLIIDVRDNTGGSLAECMAAAGAFVGESHRILKTKSAEQTISYINGRVRTIGQSGEEVEQLRLSQAANYDGPVVVLVNAKSASCAEYFALDLKDRALVIGEATFGLANSVAGFAELSNGGALQITTARTFQLNGELYPKYVTPEVLIEDDLSLLVQGQDILISKAIHYLLEGYLIEGY